jgi:hypothetical protein
MKNADVIEIVRQARALGRELQEDEAELFLLVKELLQREPDNKAARKVAERFQRFLLTGEWLETFATFMIPNPQSPELLERGARASVEYAKRAMSIWGDLPQLRIVEKCIDAGVFWPTGPGKTEGWRGFAKRTDLTAAQVERMSDEELRKFA